MTDSIQLDLLSTPVTLFCTPGPYASYLRGLLSALTVPDPPAGERPTIVSLETDRRIGPRFVGVSNGERFVATDSAPDFVRLVLWQLNRLAAEGSNDLLLHAGVASRAARAVLLAGGSGSGKSTLVAGLVRAGFDYLSDEMACIEVEGMVRPYPRPLSLRAGAFPALPELEPTFPSALGDLRNGSWHLPPDTVRIGCVGGRATIDLVAFIRYQPGAPAEVALVHRAEAIARLLEQRLPSRVPGSEALRRLAKAMQGVRCYEIGFGALDEAVAAIVAAAESGSGSISRGRGTDRTSRRST